MAPPIPVKGPVNSRDTRGQVEVTFSTDGLSATVDMGGKKLEVPIDPVTFPQGCLATEVGGPKTMFYDGSMKPMRLDELPMHNKWGIPWTSRTFTEKEVLVLTAAERTQTTQAHLKASGRLNARLPDFLEDMGTAVWKPYTSEEQNSLLSNIASKAWEWDDSTEDLEETAKKEAAAKKEDAATVTVPQRGWEAMSWGWMPDPALIAKAQQAKSAPGPPPSAKAESAKPKSRFSPNVKKS